MIDTGGRELVLYKSVTGRIVFRVYVPASWGYLADKYPHFYLPQQIKNFTTYNKGVIKYEKRS